MMKCEKAQRMISAYIDSELLEKDIADLWAHMDSCQLCMTDYKGLKKIQEAIPAEEVNPSSYFKMNFWKRVEKEKERANIFYRKLIFLPAYAAAGLVLMITFFSSTLLYAYKSTIKDSSVHKEIVMAYVEEGVLTASLTPMSCARLFERGIGCIEKACAKKCENQTKEMGCGQCGKKCLKDGRRE
ncbi:zf-HC2 domain-containing protein [bacterium]|nr:zf-HC2 domain-containing protein [Candidatus Omnitrophota bacterium]MBU2527930.1 zf-HC2 domain-containing protein [bacterium]MBU3929283.1 zf-HC2 domain-containing protein [bacterium]MBU4122236.1 zf-HC2 domain-containing protein [bacterium]